MNINAYQLEIYKTVHGENPFMRSEYIPQSLRMKYMHK